ncbi:TPA: hypothetical protein HA246_01490 [Candidatus Woesearchaeota archaeon]|nr:hypothetical protein [Candidatus Woesearchaeota archaeon]
MAQKLRDGQASGLESKLRFFLSGHEPFKGNMWHVDQNVVDIVRYVTGKDRIKVGFLGFGDGKKQRVLESSTGRRHISRYAMDRNFFTDLGDEFAAYYNSLHGVESVDAFVANLICTIGRDREDWDFDPNELASQFEKLKHVDLLYVGGGDTILLESFIRTFRKEIMPILQNTHLALYSAPAMILGSHWIWPTEPDSASAGSEEIMRSYRKHMRKIYGTCEYLPMVSFMDREVIIEGYSRIITGREIQKETGVILRRNPYCILTGSEMLAFKTHCEAVPKGKSRHHWSQDFPLDYIRAVTAELARLAGYEGRLIDPRLADLVVVSLEGETGAGFVLESAGLRRPNYVVDGTYGIHSDGSEVNIFKQGEVFKARHLG